MEDAQRKFTEEAAKAQTVEELMELAEAYGIEATEDEARLFLSLQTSEGVLSDEVLDDVSGGGLHYKGRLIVTYNYKCDRFKLRRTVSTWSQPHCELCEHVDFSGFFTVCKIN